MKNEINISDILLERPVGFTIEEKRFYIYPLSLGKLTLISEITKASGLNMQYMVLNPLLEVQSMVERNKELAARIVAYGTCQGRDVFDEDLVSGRASFFKENMEDGDMTTLLIAILTNDKTDKAISQLGIDDEQRRMQKVVSLTDNKHNVSFGGSSVYGTVIDAACERYGWTMDYVLWGISYSNLRLLLADKVSQMYLNDDELKKCRGLLTRRSDRVNVDKNPGLAREIIKAQFKD